VSQDEDLAPLISLMPPSELTDSVDLDDGVIDGFGVAGYSITAGLPTCTEERCVGMIAFVFDELNLPTAVGIVATDMQQNETVIFAAYDADGDLLGQVRAPSLGDLDLRGRTDEDRFFGVFSDGGISTIILGTSPLRYVSTSLRHLPVEFSVLSPRERWRVRVPLFCSPRRRSED